MTDRIEQILKTAIPVTASEVGEYTHVPVAASGVGLVVVASADVHWLAGQVESARQAAREIMAERNTWARELADMCDERDTAREELKVVRNNASETENWQTSRIVDLETAVQKVLEADGKTTSADYPNSSLAKTVRNLRAVWARA